MRVAGNRIAITTATIPPLHCHQIAGYSRDCLKKTMTQRTTTSIMRYHGCADAGKERWHRREVSPVKNNWSECFAAGGDYVKGLLLLMR